MQTGRLEFRAAENSAFVDLLYLRLPASYFEPRTLITILRKMFAEEMA